MLKVTGFSSEENIKYASFLNHESNIVYFDLVSSLNQDDCVFINHGDTCLITLSKQGDLIDIEIMGVLPIYCDKIDYPVVDTSFYGIPQIDSVNSMKFKTAPILILSNNNEEGFLILGDEPIKSIDQVCTYDDIKFYIQDMSIKAIAISNVIRDLDSLNFGKWIDENISD